MIANEKYRHFSRLTSPVRDMTALQSIFQKHAFHVHLVTNLESKSDIRAAVQAWVQSLSDRKLMPEDRVVVAYAGHGYLVFGKPVMIPCGLDPRAVVSEEDILDQGYALDLLLSNVRKAVGPDRLVVVMYDACQTAHRGDFDGGHGAPAVRSHLLGSLYGRRQLVC
jgi:hypothetical protein